ncbi:ephrin-A3 isoform X2 [Diceros bicornis minor]|uniref:ephrin-A3 isoform X2 n=1 Tax=Diceros bicornis minor TaxID=77932 RepID=UPI0026EDCB96|nr:ephrin-A3 isoform X2 [Diceros bicornis minor]
MDRGNPGLGLGVAGACAVSVVTKAYVPFFPPPFFPASFPLAAAWVPCAFATLWWPPGEGQNKEWAWKDSAGTGGTRALGMETGTEKRGSSEEKPGGSEDPGEGLRSGEVESGLALGFLLSDPLPFRHSLRREGYTVQVNVNDYLDIYCPHYNSSGVGPGAGPGPGGGVEQYVLYMVSRAGYRTCNASQGFKRWECNRPHAPHSPIKFSEKFQRYSAFSLGYEFHAGHEYYYISTPTHNLHWKCLRMKVFVCCASKDFEGENRQVPKLEKSISGTSPKREHLPLAVGIAFFLMTLLAS